MLSKKPLINTGCRIDSLWQGRILYFTMSMVVCSMTTFAPLYLHHRWHLSPDQLGVIATMSGMIFVGSMWWSALVDQWRGASGKAVLLLCTVAYALVMGALMLGGRSPLLNNERWGLVWTTVAFGVCNFFASALFPIIDAVVLDALNSHNNDDNGNESNHYNNGNESNHYNNNETNHYNSGVDSDYRSRGRRGVFRRAVGEFGKVRVWGTIGHASVILLSSQAIEWTRKLHSPTDSPYTNPTGLFVLMLVSCAVFIVMVMVFLRTTPASSLVADAEVQNGGRPPTPAEPARGRGGRNGAAGGGLWGQLGQMSRKVPSLLHSKPSYVTFLLVVMVIGWARAIPSFWLILLMDKNMQRKARDIAVSASIRTLAELAILYWARPLNARIGSMGMLGVCQVAGIVRLAAYGWCSFQGSWWYLTYGVELLKGVSSSAFTASAVELASELVLGKKELHVPSTDDPSHTQTQEQPLKQVGGEDEDRFGRTLAIGLMYGVYNGFSASFAGLTGGALLRWYCQNEVDALFRVAAVISSVAFGGYLVWVIVASKRQPTTVRENKMVNLEIPVLTPRTATNDHVIPSK